MRETPPRRQSRMLLIGASASWWGSRSADARDHVQLATMARGTPEHRRERDGTGRRRASDSLIRRAVRWLRVRRGVELEEVAGVVELRAAAGTQEPEVANFGKAARQHVLEEAPDDGVDREREAPRLLRARVGVAERDAIVVESLKPRVGEGDVKHIPRQITEGMIAAPDLLEMDGPPAVPDGGRDLVREARPASAHHASSRGRVPTACSRA